MLLLKKLNQPYLIAYIIAGIILGPYVLGSFTKPDEIEIIGEIGILLLMFFLGMEINVPNNQEATYKTCDSTKHKILLSIICALAIGYMTELSLNSMILIAVLLYSTVLGSQ
jgi:CPA2 family monovalent cation:H+ antiporter-2